MLRQRAIRLLRKAYLLPRVEQCRFHGMRLRHAGENGENPGFAFPPLDIIYDAHEEIDRPHNEKDGK